MKNNKLFLKIYLSLLIIFIITLIILTVLGNKTRIGYLTEFKFDEHHINKTLELNNFDIEETKKLFMINGELDNEALTNYIFTNELITNYSYGFRLKYYSTIFRNSDIYGVYPDINKFLKENTFIKEIKMDDNKGTPFGNLISSIKIDSDKIDNIDYKLSIKKSIKYFVYLIVIYCILIMIYYKIKSYNNNLLSFSIIVFIIVLSLFIFQFWLCFPGYFQYGDSWSSMIEGIHGKYSNIHPIIIGFFLRIMYKLFGYHSFYLLFLNLFLWYTAIYILVLSIYFKYKSYWSLSIICISLLANIFFLNINHIKDVTASLWVFFSYSLILSYLIIQTTNKKINIILISSSIISLIIGMLWRHNFIVTIYPMFILYTYMILNKKNISNIKEYIIKYISIMLLFAIILISLIKFYDSLSNAKNYSNNIRTNHIFLLQITGIAILSNDPSLIPNEWYREGHNFETLKKIHNKTPFFADNIGHFFNKNAPLKSDDKGNIKDLKKIWIKSIIKYPLSYVKYMFNYTKTIWTIHTWKIYSNNLQLSRKYEFLKDDNRFDYTEIKLTPLKEEIYSFLIKVLLDINIFNFIIASIFLFLFSLKVLINYKTLRNNLLLIFILSTSSSSICTAVIVALFTPIAVLYRYIHPVVPITIISIIAFILFLKNIGGINKIYIKDEK